MVTDAIPLITTASAPPHLSIPSVLQWMKVVGEVEVPVMERVPVVRDAEIAAPLLLMGASVMVVDGVSVTFAKAQLVMVVVEESMMDIRGKVIVRFADAALIVTLVSESCPLLTLNIGHSIILSVVGSNVKVSEVKETLSPSTVKMEDASLIFETVFPAESVPVMERSVLDALLNIEATVSVGWSDDPMSVISENVPSTEYA